MQNDQIINNFTEQRNSHSLRAVSLIFADKIQGISSGVKVQQVVQEVVQNYV